MFIQVLQQVRLDGKRKWIFKQVEIVKRKEDTACFHNIFQFNHVSLTVVESPLQYLN